MRAETIHVFKAEIKDRKGVEKATWMVRFPDPGNKTKIGTTDLCTDDRTKAQDLVREVMRSADGDFAAVIRGLKELRRKAGRSAPQNVEEVGGFVLVSPATNPQG